MSHRLGMLTDTANRLADGGVKVAAAPSFLCSLSSDDTLI